MKEGANSHSTYLRIKNLPGIQLKEELQGVWDNSRAEKYQLGYITKDTLSTGHMPAFHFLFETIDDNYGLPSSIYDAEALIKQFTGLSGNKLELKSWYEKNKNSIIYLADHDKFGTAEDNR